MISAKFALLLLFIVLSSSRPVPDGQPHVFHFEGSNFMLDNQEFQLVGGEIHYARIPFEYWRHRIQMVKALGCNTLSVYIFWNFHSPSEGVYDFTTENKNLKLFLQIAQEEGMWVLIRPGPYVCAEWDAGGHPWWLMKVDGIQLRTTDVKYVRAVQEYINHVIQIIAPLQVTRGGNIIMLQIENEYGYLMSDTNWMKTLYNLWKSTGQIEIPYYHADPVSGMKSAHIPNLAIGINPGIKETSFADARKIDPNVPIFSSETWLGWMTHWGENFSGQTVQESVKQVTFLMGSNYPFSIYMAHGGTNFGFWAGSNYNDITKQFSPDITSYDYDAAINEMGQVTERYNALRQLIQKHVSWQIPEPPFNLTSISITSFKPEKFSTIWNNLSFGHLSNSPLSMEKLDQAFGLVVYKTTLNSLKKGDIISFDSIHDNAWVYVNNDFIGDLDRRNSLFGFHIKVPTNYNGQVELTILVEGMGRINFGKHIFDQKGIIGKVQLNGKEVQNWSHASIPLDENYLSNLTENSDSEKDHGIFFKGQFLIQNVGDTYIDMSKWKKGLIWVNGRNLGRYWSIGPQQRLYCPGVWLKKGVNQIMVLDLNISEAQEISGVQQFK